MRAPGTCRAPLPRRRSAHAHSSNQSVVPARLVQETARRDEPAWQQADPARASRPIRRRLARAHDHSYSPRHRAPATLDSPARGAAIAGGRPRRRSAGTYDVVSCGAPGANGVNRAWQVSPDFDDRFFDVAPALPGAARRTRSGGAGVTAPNFTGAGFELTAPPGAILDRMVIWRTGYRFNNDGTAQGPWVVQGYRADASVIGGPLTGETCVIAPGQPFCRFGAEGAMAPGARVERDLETDEGPLLGRLLRRRRLPDRQRPGLPVRRAEHLGLDRHRARRTRRRG